MKKTYSIGIVLATVSFCASAADVKLVGPFGERLDKMIRNHVVATDAKYLADFFHERTRETWWQTEFWGKYMHSAVPFWRYSGNDELKRKLDVSVARIIAAQEPSGYIGNYPEETRYGKGWDVWGTKYTLMGLMHYYDGTGDSKSLDAARRLCDYLIDQLGPNGKMGTPLHLSGQYAGLPSCSVLEPVVWLYRRTHDKRYLDFATYIVHELCDPSDGPRLVAQADVPVAERRLQVVPEIYAKYREHAKDQLLTKAYELMSCYQGLVEYYEVTGERQYLEAAVKTAESIRTTEINLAGGSAAGEHWYHGATEQDRRISWLQETCVTITWMRLCAKLLTVTGEARWADELEKTFYNAYLAALSPAADKFAAYTPLEGYRSRGHHHCRTHTDCCNANGPRGYLAVLESLISAKDDVVTLNMYISGYATVDVPKTGRKARFQVYTLYPRDGQVQVWYRSRDPQDFTLRLHVSASTANAVVLVNGKAVADAKVRDGYIDLARTWREMDKVELRFDMPVRMHRLHESVAFTRGPICLARDSRFGEGVIDEDIRVREIGPADLASFRLVCPPTTDMFMAMAAVLPAGSHSENWDAGKLPRVIFFTDYASAGNTWQPTDRYRVWLPELTPGRTY